MKKGLAYLFRQCPTYIWINAQNKVLSTAVSKKHVALDMSFLVDRGFQIATKFLVTKEKKNEFFALRLFLNLDPT